MGGCCGPQNDEEKAEREINQHMNQDSKEQKRLNRILLLGPGDSGKSTIIKQMKKIHHGNIGERELKDYISVIRQSILKNMAILCQSSKYLEEDHDTNVDESLQNDRDYFAEDSNISLEDNDLIQNADVITKLWKDKGIQKTFHLRNLFHIPESAAYFFDRIDEINKKDYFPSFDDYLRFRLRTSGISREPFNVTFSGHSVPFEIIDVGGQRSERKKWMELIAEDIKAVLYVFSVGEFDKFLFEDANVKRLHESLDLFKKTIKQGFFDGKTVIIFLNKYDLFQERIKDIPITTVFEDYPDNQDPNDCELVIQFIMDKFKSIWTQFNKNSSSTLVMHCTTALDTSLIDNIMHDIQLGLVRHMLDRVGLN